MPALRPTRSHPPTSNSLARKTLPALPCLPYDLPQHPDLCPSEERASWLQSVEESLVTHLNELYNAKWGANERLPDKGRDKVQECRARNHEIETVLWTGGEREVPAMDTRAFLTIGRRCLYVRRALDGIRT